MQTIVFLDSYTSNPGDLSWKDFESLGDFHQHENLHDIERISLLYPDVDVLISNKVYVGNELLERLPNLKLVCVAATGYNSIDVQACQKRNITVCNVVGYSAPSVAQHVFSNILGYIHHPLTYNKEVAEGKWSNQAHFSYFNQSWNELSGQALGIIGFGKIGQAVASVAIGFGMKVFANKRNPIPFNGVEYVSKEQIFRESDFISLHTPLTTETEKMVNAKTLAMMKKSAVLINTGRGPLIDEMALKNALESKQIKAAFLDVLSVEPPPQDHLLFGLENCYITPHNAWTSVESRSRLLKGIYDNILAFNAGSPQNVVS